MMFDYGFGEREVSFADKKNPILWLERNGDTSRSRRVRRLLKIFFLDFALLGGCHVSLQFPLLVFRHFESRLRIWTSMFKGASTVNLLAGKPPMTIRVRV